MAGHCVDRHTKGSQRSAHQPPVARRLAEVQLNQWWCSPGCNYRPGQSCTRWCSSCTCSRLLPSPHSCCRRQGTSALQVWDDIQLSSSVHTFTSTRHAALVHSLHRTLQAVQARVNVRGRQLFTCRSTVCCAAGPEAMALKGAMLGTRVGVRCWLVVPSASWPYSLFPAYQGGATGRQRA